MQDFDDAVIDEIDRESKPATKPDTPPASVPATVKTDVPTAPVPPGMKLMDPFDAYLEREGANEVFFDGRYYNFNGQTGRWTCNKQPIDLTAPLLCHVSGGIALGWIKMIDNKIVDRSLLGYLINGYVPPPLEKLPDRDERYWPLNRQGEREDPWKKTVYLSMRTADGESVVFAPLADTQIRPVNNFIRVCRRTDHGGKDPLVLLGSESFLNSHDGITHKPTFKIKDWQYWTPDVPAPPPKPVLVPIAGPAKPVPAKLAAPAETKRGDMDDEIPF